MRKDQTSPLAQFLFDLAAAFTQYGEAIEANTDTPADEPEAPAKGEPKSSGRSRSKAKDEPAPEKEEPKSSGRSRSKAKPEPEPEPEPEPDGDDITAEDLQELSSQLLEAGKRKVLKGILDEFGIKSLSAAEEDQYDDLYDALYDAVEALG